MNLKYCLKYEKDITVTAIKGSLGIFCFTSKYFAKKWLKGFISNCYNENLKKYQIVRVKPVGDGIIPKSIAVGDSFISIFYNHGGYGEEKTTIIPDGTICYPTVEVLD
jgi:hypothetical protein